MCNYDYIMDVHKVVVEHNWSLMFILKMVAVWRISYRKQSDPWVQGPSLGLWRDATPDMFHWIYYTKFEIVLMWANQAWGIWQLFVVLLGLQIPMSKYYRINIMSSNSITGSQENAACHRDAMKSPVPWTPCSFTLSAVSSACSTITHMELLCIAGQQDLLR